MKIDKLYTDDMNLLSFLLTLVSKNDKELSISQSLVNLIFLYMFKALKGHRLGSIV